MFDPSYRPNNSQNLIRNALGNRIGLSVCKQICTELGGGIRVFSKIGKGTMIVFSMQVFDVS